MDVEQILNKILQAHVRFIKESFNIELNTREVLRLRGYMFTFNNIAKKRNLIESYDKKDLYILTSEHAYLFDGHDDLYFFLLDNYGLDMLELGTTEIKVFKHGKEKIKKYGSGWIGTPEFKEYCRQNRDYWIDERTNL